MCMQCKRWDSFPATVKAGSLVAEGQKIAAPGYSLKRMAKILYVNVICWGPQLAGLTKSEYT